MNISTYESRIKALEDQLNPPGPVPETGLVSVVVTPDIKLSDGTSLNAKLAALMPMEPGARVSMAETSISGELGPEGVSVTLTPASGWLALANLEPTEGSVFEHGEIGNPLTVTVPTIVGENKTMACAVVGAAGTFPLGEGETDSCLINLQITKNNMRPA